MSWTAAPRGDVMIPIRRGSFGSGFLMLIPADIRTVGETELFLTWSDGKRQLYPFEALRFQCPCAGCVDEMTGERRIRLDQIKAGIHVLDWKQVGNYALQFRWSDGHQTGIYSYEYLYSMKS